MFPSPKADLRASSPPWWLQVLSFICVQAHSPSWTVQCYNTVITQTCQSEMVVLLQLMGKTTQIQSLENLTHFSVTNLNLPEVPAVFLPWQEEITKLQIKWSQVRYKTRQNVSWCRINEPRWFLFQGWSEIKKRLKRKSHDRRWLCKCEEYKWTI